MATTTNKTFDAVEMSRRLREETSRKLAALTREQQIAVLNAQLRSAPRAEAETCVVREEPPET